MHQFKLCIIFSALSIFYAVGMVQNNLIQIPLNPNFADDMQRYQTGYGPHVIILEVPVKKLFRSPSKEKTDAIIYGDFKISIAGTNEKYLGKKEFYLYLSYSCNVEDNVEKLTRADSTILHCLQTALWHSDLNKKTKKHDIDAIRYLVNIIKNAIPDKEIQKSNIKDVKINNTNITDDNMTDDTMIDDTIQDVKINDLNITDQKIKDLNSIDWNTIKLNWLASKYPSYKPNTDIFVGYYFIYTAVYAFNVTDLNASFAHDAIAQKYIIKK